MHVESCYALLSLVTQSVVSHLEVGTTHVSNTTQPRLIEQSSQITKWLLNLLYSLLILCNT